MTLHIVSTINCILILFTGASAVFKSISYINSLNNKFKEDDAVKIEKLPSGSYRIRKMYKGKTYAVTFDRKPTQKEAIKAMSEELNKVQSKQPVITFKEAAAGYVDMKRNVLSPRTIKEYSDTSGRLPEWFKELRISDITQIEINKLVNELSKGKSPKTVRNYHGFISAVLATYRPEMKIYTKLPQKVKNEPYIPSTDDVKKILEYAQGTMFEIPIILACYGMRRSEICALTVGDIDGTVVKINKAMVQDENRKWVIKTTKTTSSAREIIIPKTTADKIRKQGYVYKGHPNSITCYLTKAQDSIGIPRFSIHKLRHYFASQMSVLGVPEADILKMGGWESDHIMKAVYRHSMMDKEENAKREASSKLQNSLFPNL